MKSASAWSTTRSVCSVAVNSTETGVSGSTSSAMRAMSGLRYASAIAVRRASTGNGRVAMRCYSGSGNRVASDRVLRQQHRHDVAGHAAGQREADGAVAGGGGHRLAAGVAGPAAAARRADDAELDLGDAGQHLVGDEGDVGVAVREREDRKSTRLNS